LDWFRVSVSNIFNLEQKKLMQISSPFHAALGISTKRMMLNTRKATLRKNASSPSDMTTIAFRDV
jgi:hypothetical protein